MTRSTAADVASLDANALSAMRDRPPIVIYKEARIGGTSSDELSPATENGRT